MSDSREGFYFFKNWRDAINVMKDPADRLAVYEAIANYALDGTVPDLDGICDIGKALLIGILPAIESGRKDWENGRKGGRPKKETSAPADPEENPGYSEEKTPVSETEKPKVRKGKELKKADHSSLSAPARETTTTTIRPTVEEVERYCSQSGIRGVDAARFIAYNDGRGWKIGDKAAEDWTALLRLWIAQDGERRGRSTPRRSPTGTFGAFQQRQYNADDLERILLSAGRPS